MKKLQQFADNNNLKLVKVTYKAQGVICRRKGFDLVDANNITVVEFEPVDYRNGDKWLIHNGYKPMYGFEYIPSYCKRITGELLTNCLKNHTKYFNELAYKATL